MKSQSEGSKHIINFDNSYARLPQQFYMNQNPVPVSNPKSIKVNHKLSEKLGVDPNWLESNDGLQVIAGNKVPFGAEPIATVYAGHQFGGWNPQLGDGRAILLGEIITPNQERFDFQLKGSGPTPYSRGGDGRAPLGPILREYIVSEAMHNLGISTTRVLTVAKTGDPVYREENIPGAILIRIAKSHIRIGTFEFFSSHQDLESLKILAEHVINRHYPQAKEQQNPILCMLQFVIQRQANLIASWQAIGFIHGVMNTDNVLLSGETIDYGPCAFMDYFDPNAVYSFIDHHGRYCYGNQPSIGNWNLMQLVQALLPLIHSEREKALELAQEAIDQYPSLYEGFYQENMCAKIGLKTKKNDDKQLVADLLNLMAEEGMDYTLTFRRLSDLVGEKRENHVGDLIDFPKSINIWIEQWQKRLAQERTAADSTQKEMYSLNPVFIPRNHLIENIIDQAVNHDNLTAFYELVDILEKPYVYDSQKKDFAIPPKPDQVVENTFCGT